MSLYTNKLRWLVPSVPSRKLNLTMLSRYLSLWSYDSDTGIVSHEKNKHDKKFQTIVGLEIHAQLQVETKLFSNAPVVGSGAKPNSQVWPLDAAVPGILPVLSQEAVHKAVLTAAALNCTIPPVSRFERKHYTYPDLPLGYQITQQRWPLATNGKLNFTLNKKQYEVGIARIQLEQDTGKTTSVRRNLDGKSTITESLVDLNRAGCALVEIVFEPNLRSSLQAGRAVETLRNLLRHAGTCDGKMQEGSLRCDLNVSIAPFVEESHSQEKKEHDVVDAENPFQSSLPPGTGNRVEVKNLNSIRHVVWATEYEALRQAQAWEEGLPTKQETRTFDVQSRQTILMRTKEGAVDYRFMPEPDLPPLVLDTITFDGQTLKEFVRDNLPELPEAATLRLQSQYNLSEQTALVITSDAPAIVFYERTVEYAMSQTSNDNNVPVMVANWLVNDVFALLKANLDDQQEDDEVSIQHSLITPQQLGELVALILNDKISTTMAKKILSILNKEQSEDVLPSQVAKERGLKLISDPDELYQLCVDIINDPKHTKQLQQYTKGGKHIAKMTKYFVGQAMKASRGNAHPELLKEALNKALKDVL